INGLVAAGLLTPVSPAPPVDAPDSGQPPAAVTSPAGAAPPASRQYEVTTRGREAILRGLGEWVAASRALAEEQADLERRRTDLLSTLSHELRTPLTLILTSSGLLIDGNPDPEMRLRLLTNV